MFICSVTILAFVFVIFGITFDPGGTGGLMVGPFNLDTLINFVDPASILIVLGGTLAVVVACYPGWKVLPAL